MAEIDFKPDSQLDFQQEAKIDFQPDAMPVVQEQGVGVFERSAVKSLEEGIFFGNAQDQIDFLESRGYIAEREGDIIKVRRPEDKQWKVVDPDGLTSIGDALQDLYEVIPDVALAVAGAGPAGVAGKAAGKAALKVGGKALKPVLKGAASIADRILSVSPTYRVGKSVVKGASKAHKQLTKIADDIADLKKAMPKTPKKK